VQGWSIGKCAAGGIKDFSRVQGAVAAAATDYQDPPVTKQRRCVIGTRILQTSDHPENIPGGIEQFRFLNESVLVLSTGNQNSSIVQQGRSVTVPLNIKLDIRGKAGSVCACDAGPPGETYLVIAGR